jgi:hypothetical protein
MELERYIPYEAFPHIWDPKGPIKCLEIAAMFVTENDLLMKAILIVPVKKGSG